jgi:pseudouridine synthase
VTPRPERLQKILARAGFGSRRACEELITAGEVRVDGVVVTELGTRADARTQAIECRGRRIRLAPLAVYVLNKPRGVISALGPHPRARTLQEFVGRLPGRFFAVGRLDKDSEGLLLLTNDGEFCNMLAHPRYQVPRTYHALIRGEVTAQVVERLRRGVWLFEGKTGPIQVKVLRRVERGRTFVEAVIREGMNREVRRVFARVGLKVQRLTRVRFDGIELGSLAPGRLRRIDPEEVRRLKEALRTGERFDDE